MITKDLLEKPVWYCEDVIAYTGFKQSKCYQIMKFCKENLNGAVRFNPHGVKRDSVLEYMGTSLEQECYLLKQLGS